MCGGETPFVFADFPWIQYGNCLIIMMTKGATGGAGVGADVTFFFADFLLTQYSNSGAVCLLIMMQEGVGVWTGKSCLFRGFSMDIVQ